MTFRRLSANAISRDDGAEISRRWLKREPDEERRCEFVAHGPPLTNSGDRISAKDSADLAALLEEMHAHGMTATVRPLVGVYETAEEAREALR